MSEDSKKEKFTQFRLFKRIRQGRAQAQTKRRTKGRRDFRGGDEELWRSTQKRSFFPLFCEK